MVDNTTELGEGLIENRGIWTYQKKVAPTAAESLKEEMRTVKNEFRNKNILVMGMGKSGIAAARFLSKAGAKVTVTDSQAIEKLNAATSNLKDLDIRWECGGHKRESFENCEMLVLSPGISLNNSWVELAAKNGTEITTEVDLAFRFIDERVIAVTGTNGKTTATTLLGEILRADGRSVFVGGNIGTPLLSYLEKQTPAEYIVAELSSYQLELTQNLKPAAAVFTNISQNHLDRYKTIENYAAAKQRLLQFCDKESLVVLNEDDAILHSWRQKTNATVLMYSSKIKDLKQGAWYDRASERIWFRAPGSETRGVDFDPIRERDSNRESDPRKGVMSERLESWDARTVKIPGIHNIENYMACICALRPFGISSKSISEVMGRFLGVPHRIEFVGSVAGTKYFNDSKSTTVVSLSTCLESFDDKNTILIMGGRDKASDFSVLRKKISQKVKLLLIYGEAREKINTQLDSFEPRRMFGELKEALAFAASQSSYGDRVVLSPACASQDQFRDFEHRGDVFRDWVQRQASFTAPY